MKAVTILSAALKDIWTSRGSLSKALALPFLVFISIPFLYLLDLPPLSESLLMFVGWVIQAVIAVVVHRVMILGKGAVPEWGITKLSKRELLFLVYAAMLSMLMIPFVPLLFIPGIGWLLFLIGASGLMGRFSLALPGVAVESSVLFQASWEITRRHQVTITLVMLTTLLATYGPRALGLLGPEMAIVAVVASGLGTVGGIAMLSRAYVFMVGGLGPDNGEADL